MSFLEIAKNRYTTKKYANRAIPVKIVEGLMEVLRLSPSSINSQPWKFVFVSNERVKQQLAEASYFNANKVSDASHVVVFCVVDGKERFVEQLKKHSRPADLQRYMQFVEGMPNDRIMPWLKNQVYISLGFFLSACAASGIDATPMEGINQKEYDAILKVEGYKTLFAVAIGYRAEDDANQPNITAKKRLPLDEVVLNIE